MVQAFAVRSGRLYGLWSENGSGSARGIEQKRYAEAEQEIVRVAKALEDEAALIESAAGELEGVGR